VPAGGQQQKDSPKSYHQHCCKSAAPSRDSQGGCYTRSALTAPAWRPQPIHFGGGLRFGLSGGRIHINGFQMKLIGSLSSPFVRKVRIVLAEKKLDYQLQLDDVWAADSVIRQHNPLGKIPCLVMDEDVPALYDSRVIVEYLDNLSPVSRLLPANGRERIDVKWWEALADGLLDAAVLIRLEYARRTPEQQSEEWLQHQRNKIDGALRVMESQLGDKPHCVGRPSSTYTLADIAVGCALGYLDFRLPEIAWRDDCPNLQRHFDKLSQRQSFIDTQPS